MNKLNVTDTKELLELKNVLQDRQCRPSDALLKVREILERNGGENYYSELWNNWKTDIELQEMLREAIDQGIDRLYYFLNETNIYNVDIMYIDNYGNCDKKLSYSDLIEVINKILSDYGADVIGF